VKQWPSQSASSMLDKQRAKRNAAVHRLRKRIVRLQRTVAVASMFLTPVPFLSVAHPPETGVGRIDPL
jgi:hypothetical protein